ncbi:MAG: ABC transporter substrate-binding protein [Chloroflexi bacterium]|nr:ABC transporter substrate-binding protein [Chloroflexota bacterium]
MKRKITMLLMVLVLILASCTTAKPAPGQETEPTVVEGSQQEPVAEPNEAASGEQPVDEQPAAEQPAASKPAGSWVSLDLAPDEVGSGPRIINLYADYPWTLDPQNTSSFAGVLSLQFFDTLVTYEVNPETGIADQTKIVPELAESWEISDDNKVLTFHLNKNAKFWDGTPVTAEDVYWSIQRALEGRMGWGTTQIETGGIYEVSQMEVVDPYTFRVTYPNGLGRYSLRNFASMSLTVMSKKACEENRTDSDPWCVEWIKKNVMGSGPYMLGDYKDGEYMVVKANKDYWGPVKPYFSEIVFQVVPDPQTRMMLMQGGEADIAFMGIKEYAALKNDSNVTVFTVPQQQDTTVMRWRTDVPPFDDIKIREAVIKAIPYERIVNEVCLGFCTPVKNLVGVNTLGYYEEPLFETDIEAAKQLVAESSYAGKQIPSFEVPLSEQSMHVNTAVIIQDALREIGLDMKIKPITSAAFDELAWDKRSLEVSIHSMQPWWNDFMYWAYWMYHTNSATNHIQFSNEMLDKSVMQAMLIPQENVDEYMALQTPVLDLLINERLATPLYQTNWTVAQSNNICNMNYFPWAQIGLEYLRSCD